MNKIKEKFLELKKKWKEETKFLSGADPFFNEYYQEIIKMGEEVLPYIFEDMKKEQNWWFFAIGNIVENKDCPDISTNALGNIDKLTKIWLNWAEKNRYING